jgi:uncharacterized protein
MNEKPLIISLVASLMFSTQIDDASHAADCEVVHPIDTAGFAAALRRHPRLIIIDAGLTNLPWIDWVQAAKDDPATDAVPIIAFGSHVDLAVRDRALAAGVDRYLAQSNFFDGLPEFIAAAVREATNQPCNEPLPESVLRGFEEFNAGQYFEQHETLELAWRAEMRPIRDLYRGILQIGVACLQIERGNAAGALKMIDRATRWLQPFRPMCQSVDVDRLLADAEQLRNEINRLGLHHLSRFNRGLFPKVHLLDSDRRATNHQLTL